MESWKTNRWKRKENEVKGDIWVGGREKTGIEGMEEKKRIYE